MPGIKINGNSVYYEITGNGHPFVFIHGGGDESSGWHSQTRYFSKRYQVITYDIRGHGRSEAPEETYAIGECVEDLHQLLDYLAVQRTYLVGFSLGGYIALSFSINYPDRVDALILAGANSGPMAETVRKRSEELAARISTEVPDSLMNYMKVHKANVARPDLTSRLSEISRPVLIIVGDQDTAAPSYIAERMHRRITNSRIVVIPNCGHRCNKEQPETFNSIVDEFLQNIEAV